MAAVLLTAMFTVHLQYGFFSVMLVEVTPPVRSYEILLLYLGGLAALCLSGPGRLSLDHWLQTILQKGKSPK